MLAPNAPCCSGRASSGRVAHGRFFASRGPAPRVVCAAKSGSKTAIDAPLPSLSRPKPASAEKQALAQAPAPPANGAAIQEAYRKAADAKARGETVEVKVASQNEGGVMVQYGPLRGFIPYNKVDPARLKACANGDLSSLNGQIIKARVVSVDVARRELILSERLVAAATALAQLKAGDEVEGVVTGVEDYGAFVQVKGVPEVFGLVHKSEVTWDRILTVDQAVRVGQEVRAKVLSVDTINCRLGLSMKQLTADPLRVSLDGLAWEAADSVEDPVVQRFIEGLSRSVGVESVKVKRVAQDPKHVAQELEVYLTRTALSSVDEEEAPLDAAAAPPSSLVCVARHGVAATELVLTTRELSREQVKMLLQRVAGSSAQ